MALFGNKKNTTKDDKTEDKKKAATKEVKKEATSPSMTELYSEKNEKKNSKVPASKKRPGSRTLAAKNLVKPLVTEKAAHLAESGKYVFIVNINANKIEIAKSVADTYGVDVVDVNIIKMKGKVVTRGRIKGFRSDFKKAVVTLKKGQSIQMYEGV